MPSRSIWAAQLTRNTRGATALAREVHWLADLYEWGKGPAEQRVFRIDPGQVTVKVSGDPNLLDMLNPEDIQADVNVGALRDPQGSMHVEVHVPPRITVVAIAPAHVDVRPISTNP